MIFFNVSVAHAGHVTSGSSLIFCTASISWLQLSQRYSYIGIYIT